MDYGFKFTVDIDMNGKYGGDPFHGSSQDARDYTTLFHGQQNFSFTMFLGHLLVSSSPRAWISSGRLFSTTSVVEAGYKMKSHSGAKKRWRSLASGNSFKRVCIMTISNNELLAGITHRTKRTTLIWLSQNLRLARTAFRKPFTRIVPRPINSKRSCFRTVQTRSFVVVCTLSLMLIALLTHR